MPTSKKYPFIPNKPPVEFKFTVPTTLELEEAAGMSIDMLRLRGQTLRALLLLVCYGLKWDDASMTEGRAKKMLSRFVDTGGNVAELTKALVEALNLSGVYGLPEDASLPKDDTPSDEDEDDADPPTTAPDTTH